MRSLKELARVHNNFNDYYNACVNEGYDVKKGSISTDIVKEWAIKINLMPSTTNTGGGGKPSGGGSGEGGKVTDFFTALKSSASFDTTPSIDVASSLQSISDAIFSLGSGSIWSEPSEVIRGLFKDGASKIISELVKYYQEQSALMTSINQRAGLSFEFAEAYRKTLTDVNPKLIQYGITFAELAYVAENLVKNTGRFYTLNEQTFTDTAKIAKAYLDDLNEIYTLLPAFERVGLGASNAMESIARAGKDSMSLGLRAQTVTKELSSNIGKLNEYGFKNGTDGLTKMVQKSIEFRMSMSEVFKIADKVMSPEGAIELAANLQVLGGAIGDFNDPMKMMYMATNNVEGLQDALLKSAGNLATYNQEQKRFEITGVNLRMAREMAAQMGVSYNELANGAIAAAEKSAAASEMMRAGLVLDDEDREFITNISKMKDGKMVIDLGESKELQNIFGSTSVALENLDQRQVDQIKEYRATLKKKSEEDIIQNQYTSITNIENTLNSIAARARVAMGRGIDDIGGSVFQQTKYLAEKLGLDTKKYEKPQDLVNAVLKFGNSLSDNQLRDLNIVKELKKLATDAFGATKDALNIDKTKTTTTSSVPITQTTTTNTSAAAKIPTTQTLGGDLSTTISSMMGNVSDSFKSAFSDIKGFGTSVVNLFDVNKSSESHLSNIRININSFLQNLTTQTARNPIVSPTSFVQQKSESSQDEMKQSLAVMTKLTDSVDKLNNQDKSTSVVHKHTHEHIIKAPAVMDLFARAVFRDPNILNEIEQTDYRSYTVPETKGPSSFAAQG